MTVKDNLKQKLLKIESPLMELLKISISQDNRILESQELVNKLVLGLANLYDLDSQKDSISQKVKGKDQKAIMTELMGLLSKSASFFFRTHKTCLIFKKGIDQCISTSDAIETELTRLKKDTTLSNSVSELGQIEDNNIQRKRKLLEIQKILNRLELKLSQIVASINSLTQSNSESNVERILSVIDSQKRELAEIIFFVSKILEEEKIICMDIDIFFENCVETQSLLNFYDQIKKNQKRKKFIRLSKQIASLILIIQSLSVSGVIGSDVYFTLHHNPIDSSPLKNQEIASRITASETNMTFKSRDNINLNGTFFKNPSADSSKVVILLHGYSGNKTQMLPLAEKYLEHNNVFIFDFRGAGQNEHSLQGLGWEERNDFLGALDYLTSQGITKVSMHGLSMGAATILFALGEERLPQNLSVAGIILQSCYANQENAFEQFNKNFGVPKALSSPAKGIIESIKGTKLSKLSPENELGKIGNIPILLIYSGSDTLVNKNDMAAMIKKVEGRAGSKILITGGSNDFDTSSNVLNQASDFLRNVF